MRLLRFGETEPWYLGALTVTVHVLDDILDPQMTINDLFIHVVYIIYLALSCPLKSSRLEVQPAAAGTLRV